VGQKGNLTNYGVCVCGCLASHHRKKKEVRTLENTKENLGKKVKI